MPICTSQGFPQTFQRTSETALCPFLLMGGALNCSSKYFSRKIFSASLAPSTSQTTLSSSVNTFLSLLEGPTITLASMTTILNEQEYPMFIFRSLVLFYCLSKPGPEGNRSFLQDKLLKPQALTSRGKAWDLPGIHNTPCSTEQKK